MNFICEYKTTDGKETVTLYDTNTHYEIYINGKLAKWINYFHTDPIIRLMRKKKYLPEIMKTYWTIVKNIKYTETE